MTEFGFIDQIKQLCANLPSNNFEGIGDDCAILPISGGQSLCYTADLLCEGVHFLRHAASPYEVGRKSVAVNLSDVAAMGARPIATLLSIALPKDAANQWAEEFMRGYHSMSAEFGVALIGGDTTRSLHEITINVTAIGLAQDAHLKRRSAAQVGDVIFAGDVLGASATGLKDILSGNFDTPQAVIHRNPMPQIEEGVWLGARSEVHAMMDISDGVASDLQHILDQSHVGATIDMRQIPVAEGSNLKDAACGGEDYKLLFTVAGENAETLQADFRAHFHKPLYPIGKITAGDSITWLENGIEKSLDWKGFTHY